METTEKLSELEYNRGFAAGRNGLEMENTPTRTLEYEGGWEDGGAERQGEAIRDEYLTEAGSFLKNALESLQEANHGIDPVSHLIMLDLLKGVAEINSRLAYLINARSDRDKGVK